MDLSWHNNNEPLGAIDALGVRVNSKLLIQCFWSIFLQIDQCRLTPTNAYLDLHIQAGEALNFFAMYRIHV